MLKTMKSSYSQKPKKYVKNFEKLGDLISSALFIIEGRKQQQNKKRMNKKSPYVKSEKITIGQLAFQDNKKGNCQDYKSDRIEFYSKSDIVHVWKSNIQHS